MRVPKHQILTFNRQPDGTYQVAGKFRTFTICRLSDPYTPRMIEMGAKYILEGHNKNGIRTLFTGLFPIGNNWFHGDLYDPQKALKRRLIIVKFTETGFKMYLFNSYPKTSKGKILTLLK
jgi:hypothetical protein